MPKPVGPARKQAHAETLTATPLLLHPDGNPAEWPTSAEEEEQRRLYGDEIDEGPPDHENWHDFLTRHAKNVIHFFVEDWFLSAMLGFITAILSISVDLGYEYLNHYRAVIYDHAISVDHVLGFSAWVTYLVVFVTMGTLACKYISVQAIGSGIPEVKVIMNGFALHNYLTFRTLIAKMLSLTLVLGGGMPLGKEGPFVHMGAIVATLLSKVTRQWQNKAFFTNEGREVEILSSGCAVGIACTFSAPAGAVLYGIESTHKYFAVKNYWRAFFATTCSALIFRFANAAIIPRDIEYHNTLTHIFKRQTSQPLDPFSEIRGMIMVTDYLDIQPNGVLRDHAKKLENTIDLDELAVDSAPFQLVLGTSLYKVHTLFSLLSLNHAYVTHRGRLVGVVALRELRLALANIYTRGAVPNKHPSMYSVAMSRNASATKLNDQDPDSNDKPPDSFAVQISEDGTLSMDVASPNTDTDESNEVSPRSDV